MKTNEIKFSDIRDAIDDILKESEKFCQYLELSEKDAHRIHLLTEETITFMRDVVGKYDATLWFENDGAKNQICLTIPTSMNKTVRDDLLSLSSTGKNAAAKTITAKIADMIEVGLEQYELVEQLKIQYGGSYTDTQIYAPGTSVSESMYQWALKDYAETVDAEEGNTEAEEAETLERSIIAKLADNVEVFIRRSGVRVVITYVAE